MTEKVSIPHVAWRKGRPRFVPSEQLRKQGHKGHDLKTETGDWMTEGQAVDWSNAFQARLDGARQEEKEKRARARRAVRRSVLRSLPATRVSRRYSFGQLLADYLDNGMDDKAPATVRNYRIGARTIEKEAPDAWLSDAEAITRPVMIGIYETLRRKRSLHTARQILWFVSGAYKWAIDRERVSCANPVYRIETQEPAPRTRAASVGEYLHLVAEADRLGMPEVADMIVWGVWTAQRAGDRLEFMLKNLVDDRLEITQQKTGTDVSIPVSRAIRARRYGRGGDPDRRFMEMPGDNPSRRYLNYYARWRKLIDEAQKTMASVADLHDQDLRDTAVSWMGRAGCTTQQIFAITGHRQQGETRILRHYMATHYDIADGAIAKLEAWFSKEVKKLKGKMR